MYGKDREGIPRPVLMTPSGQLSGQRNLADAAINGRLFHTCSQASSVTSITLAEAHSGLLLGNPVGSGKYLVMHEFGWAIDGTTTNEGTIGLATGAIGNMAFVAAPVIYSSLIGSGFSSVAWVDQAGVTAGTLSLAKVIAEFDDDTAGTQYGTTTAHVADLKGSIVIAPGYLIGTDTNVAFDDLAWFHFQWEEIDII